MDDDQSGRAMAVDFCDGGHDPPECAVSSGSNCLRSFEAIRIEENIRPPMKYVSENGTVQIAASWMKSSKSAPLRTVVATGMRLDIKTGSAEADTLNINSFDAMKRGCQVGALWVMDGQRCLGELLPAGRILT